MRRVRCAPCHEGTPALKEKEIRRRLKKLKGWRYLKKSRAIGARFRMKNFISAVKAIQKISLIAEKMDHHPDLHLTGYRNLAIEISTHSIGGVSENDLILAGKIQPLLTGRL